MAPTRQMSEAGISSQNFGQAEPKPSRAEFKTPDPSIFLKMNTSSQERVESPCISDKQNVPSNRTPSILSHESKYDNTRLTKQPDASIKIESTEKPPLSAASTLSDSYGDDSVDGVIRSVGEQKTNPTVPSGAITHDDLPRLKFANPSDDGGENSRPSIEATCEQKSIIADRGEKRVSIKEPPDSEKKSGVDSEFDSGRRSLEDVSRDESLENLVYSDSSQELDPTHDQSSKSATRHQDSAHDSAHDSHSSVEVTDDTEVTLAVYPSKVSTVSVNDRTSSSYGIPSSHGFTFAGEFLLRSLYPTSQYKATML